MIVRSKTFRNWMKANFTRQDLKDMVTHGVSSGFSGLIYYTETAKLYDKFSDEIWDALYDDAQNMGYNNVLQFIVECFRDSDVASDAQFKNMLVWYMAERTARELLEDNDINFLKREVL